MRRRLPTWGAWKNKSGHLVVCNDWCNVSEFEYEGSVQEGTKIFYGESSIVTISKDKYLKIFQDFKKNTPFKMGTSRTSPPNGSVGNWLKDNVTETAIASYVGSILIHEGYAIKGEDPSSIEFRKNSVEG